MNAPRGFLPFMDIMMGLVGIVILINIILALNISQTDRLKVRILPKDMTGGSRKLVPVHAVCSWDHIAVGDVAVDIPVTEDDYRSLEALIVKALDEAGEGAYLLALVRPDGFKAFKRLRTTVRSLRENGRELDFGYEPVNSDWEIRPD